MSQVVVDTDVASYLFNWHTSAPDYVDAQRGSQLVLSFMSVAEMRMGAISARCGRTRGSPPRRDAPLATNNRRDYERIASLRLLAL